MSSSSPSEKSSATSTSYKIFRRLPPFYTLQPNLQSQAKQISCWGDFILDLATAAFHQTGAIGIQVTPHSPLFKSPPEVNRSLASKGARSVLRALMENQGGYRCLPLALEDEDENNNNNEVVDNVVKETDDDENEFDLLQNNEDGDDENDNKMQQPLHSSIFSNCDALVVLALPCEKIVQAIWSWHDELQTSHIFSVSELAEDNDIKKRIGKLLQLSTAATNQEAGENVSSSDDVGLMILGESISCENNNNNTKKMSSSIHVSPLSYATVIETIMTTEHPAMAHLKRPTLISGSGGSLGLKFG